MRKNLYKFATIIIAVFGFQPIQAQLNLAWQEVGPNNLGTHCRAIAIAGSNVWAGSVGGGLFKSTNGGLTWFVEPGLADNLAVSTIAAEGNNIYVGTGETYFFKISNAINSSWTYSSILSYPNGHHQYAGMPGEGVFVSNDGGATWTHDNGTWNSGSTPYNDDFMSIQKVVVKNGKVLIGTLKGLYYSNDANLATVTLCDGTNNFKNKPICDVEFGSGNIVWASTPDSLYKSTDGGVTFGPGINALIPTAGATPPYSRLGGDRIEIAVAPSNPSVVYVTGALETSTNGNCTGVFKTADDGASWSRVAPYESGTFLPFKNNGIYNMVLAVVPDNENSFYIGGGSLFIYTDEDGLIEAYSPIYAPGFFDNFLPMPIHNMVFDPSNPDVFYIATDKQIMKSSDGGETYNYRSKGFNCGHMYSVSANPIWEVIGGERYTGVIHKYNGNSNIGYQEFDVIYDDTKGARVRYSVSNYENILASGPDGGIVRSLSDGDTWETFYGFPLDSCDHPLLGTDSLWIDRATDSTAGGALYDNKTPPMNPWVLDEVFAPSDLNNDTTIMNIPVYLYMASRHFVWVCSNPFGTLDSLPSWNRLSFDLTSPGETGPPQEYITALAVSGDNNHTLYAGTNEGKIYRIMNANNPCAIDPSVDVFRVDTSTAGMPNRWITGFAFDPNNTNNLVVTYGAYGPTATSYVYISNNALAADPSTVSFRDIGSSFPEITPAYCAAFTPGPNGVGLLVGTEIGLFGTTGDWESASPLTWNSESAGFGRVPVYDIYIRPYYKVDIDANNWKYGSDHTVFLATHGRGIFKSTSIIANDKPVTQNGFDAVLYPNPTTASAHIDFTLDAPASVSFEVFSLEGRRVAVIEKQQYASGTFTVELNTSDYNTGMYLVNAKVESGNSSHTKTLKAVVIK